PGSAGAVWRRGSWRSPTSTAPLRPAAPRSSPRWTAHLPVSDRVAHDAILWSGKPAMAKRQGREEAMAVIVASDPAGYEICLGRWTSRLAAPFLEFAGIRLGQRVLDVDCGTGVITAAVADRRA